MVAHWIGVGFLGMLGGIGKAMRDTIAFNWDTSIFNKIKNERLRRWFQSTGDRPDHIIWFLWDGWHFGDTLSYMAILAAMFLVSMWLQIILCAILFGSVFQLFFHVMFKD